MPRVARSHGTRTPRTWSVSHLHLQAAVEVLPAQSCPALPGVYSAALQYPHKPAWAAPARSSADAHEVCAGLLCLKQAKEGGVSSWASSHSIHNAMLRSHPDLVGTMAEPWHVDRKNEARLLCIGRVCAPHCWHSMGDLRLQSGASASVSAPVRSEAGWTLQVPPGAHPYYVAPIFNYHEVRLLAHPRGGCSEHRVTAWPHAGPPGRHVRERLHPERPAARGRPPADRRAAQGRGGVRRLRLVRRAAHGLRAAARRAPLLHPPAQRVLAGLADAAALVQATSRWATPALRRLRLARP